MKKNFRLRLVIVALFIQVVSLILFVGEIILDSYGKSLVHISWEAHEIIELTAAAGLAIGSVIGFFLIRDLISRNKKVEGQLRVASGEFHALLIEHFANWGLSPSETDVAYFAIKGMSNQQISGLRGTSEGTVKAQLNAVYKKGGIESRSQLFGYFIEELMATDEAA